MNFHCTHKVVFIDSAVADYETLASGATNGAEVIILNPEQNGIAQITDYLNKNAPIDSIHIVSHGSPATLYLGNTTLSLSNLNNYQEHLSKWSAKAIYLYGCNVAVGDAGEEFVTKLHEITGASIAASKTLTGNGNLGGDWKLEATRGAISLDEAFSETATQAYSGILGTYIVDTLQDQEDGIGTNGTSLREAMEAAQNNSQFELDIIYFNPSLYGQTITLTQGGLSSSNPVTIIGNQNNPVAISGNNSYRVFRIDNATLNGLKIINGSAQDGGGINGSNLTLINSSVLNNTALGLGGGLILGGNNTIINSTIANNKAANEGGGFFNGGITSVINSTISNNSAVNRGGGIFNKRYGSLNIANSTFTQNRAPGGSGIYLYRSGSSVVNTIIAGNISNASAGVLGDDVRLDRSGITSLGHNLIGTGNATDSFTAPGDKTGVTDPRLDSLSYNGGGTLTHALLNGSLAINAGDNDRIAFDTYDLDGDGNTNEKIPFDQTGENRIKDGVVDIGAVESSFIDGSPPKLKLLDATVKEGNSGTTFAVFPIQISKPFSKPITLKYSTINGTATSPTDFVGATNKTLVIPAYQSNANLNVAVRGDVNIEQDETFTVRILSATNATLNDSVGIGKIVNDDIVSVSLDKNLTLSEGNYGTKTANFVLRLSKPSAIPVRVAFNTLNGTATNGTDFFGVNQVINFVPNQTTATVKVPIRGDLTFEPNESFSVRISNPVNATIGKNLVTATITNDDLKPKISISDAKIGEGSSGARNMTFNVKLSNPSSQYVTAFYSTINGSAKSPLDYNAKSGQITFSPGQTTKPVFVQVRGDKLREGNEVFYVQLTGLKNATPLDLRGTGTILNDDYQSKALVGSAESFTLGEFTKELTRNLGLDDSILLGTSISNERIAIEGITQPALFPVNFGHEQLPSAAI